MLEGVPVFDRNLLPLRRFGVELAETGNIKAVAVAGDVVVDPEGRDLIAAQFECLDRGIQFLINNFKRQVRSDDPEGIYNPREPLGSHHGKGRRPIPVCHGKKHPRKPGNVVGVVVGKQHGINRVGAPPLLGQSNLGSLPAVDQEVAAVVAAHQGRKPPIGKGHHAGRSQKTYIEHMTNVNLSKCINFRPSQPLFFYISSIYALRSNLQRVFTITMASSSGAS